MAPEVPEVQTVGRCRWPMMSAAPCPRMDQDLPVNWGFGSRSRAIMGDCDLEQEGNSIAEETRN